MSRQIKYCGGLLLAATLLAAPAMACAQAIDEGPNTVGRALQQPFRDLNLIRSKTDPVLVQALTNPYDNQGLESCGAVRSRIAELEAVLGPDINAARAGGSAASELAAGAVGGVVDLPFSGIVRHLTGAYAQDQVHRRAVLAGMVRRGYLNGVWRSMSCDRPSVAASAKTPSPEADVAEAVNTTVTVPASPDEFIAPPPELTNGHIALPSPAAPHPEVSASLAG